MSSEMEINAKARKLLHLSKSLSQVLQAGEMESLDQFVHGIEELE